MVNWKVSCSLSKLIRVSDKSSGLRLLLNKVSWSIGQVKVSYGLNQFIYFKLLSWHGSMKNGQKSVGPSDIRPKSQEVHWCCADMFLEDSELDSIWAWLEQHIFGIVIDCRGRHWKGIAIYNVTEVNLHPKTFVLINKRCIFEHRRKV